MDRNDRHGRDAAGVGPYARERERLVSMSSLESWEMSDGEPDIRGWEVRTVSGRQLGSVTDLLVDKEEGEVVLLDIDLPGTDQHTFVPIRVVALDRPGRLILMDSADLPATGLARSDLGTVPAHDVVVRTVRYPVVEREVEVTPQELADAAEVVPERIADVRPADDRRQVQRRATDRSITDR
jgi:hypothetical protein